MPNSTTHMKIKPVLTTKQQTTFHIVFTRMRQCRRHGFSRPFFTPLALLSSFALGLSDPFGRWPFALRRPAVQQVCQIHLWWLRCSEQERNEFLCRQSLFKKCILQNCCWVNPSATTALSPLHVPITTIWQHLLARGWCTRTWRAFLLPLLHQDTCIMWVARDTKETNSARF